MFTYLHKNGIIVGIKTIIMRGRNMENLKVAFCSLGCKVNQYETNAMAQKFIENGFSVVDFEETADIYIVNTCTVTSIADKKSRQMLRRAKEHNQNSIVVACGCYAQVAAKEIEEIDEVDLVIGNNEKSDIIKIVLSSELIFISY